MASNNLQCDTGFKIRTGDTTGISNGNAYAPPWAGDDWDGQATKTILKYCCKYTCYHHMTSNSLQCPEGSTMRNKWDDHQPGSDNQISLWLTPDSHNNFRGWNSLTKDQLNAECCSAKRYHAFAS